MDFASKSSSFLHDQDPLQEDISLFLIQLAIIICLSKSLGFILKRIGQPAVIAEVIGGILLGPSAFGRIPGFTATIFPPSSLPLLKLVADFGLVLFLFLIGMELDPGQIQAALRKCSVISLAGIILPFILSLGVSKLLYDAYIPPTIPFATFALFCGVIMSITAFPVLARILTGQHLINTKVGQIALAAGMINDAVAWSLIILVISLVNNPSQAITALYAFLIIIAFAGFLWVAVRPFLQYFSINNGNEASTVVFVTMALSAFFTQSVGSDVIFGAFLVGIIVPHDGLAQEMSRQIEDVVTTLLVPIYFAFAGLNVDLSELDSFKVWGYTLLVIFTACVGKIVGCTFGARVTGIPWRESLTIGFLMNTKGYAIFLI
jgi:Kef-type K+ transport system membrane component KefB